MEAIVAKTVAHLNAKELIVFPTDTIWGIGADARDEAAVARIYSLKNRPESRAMICLVANVNMLQEYLQQRTPFPKELTQNNRPTSVVFSHPQGVAKNLIAPDDTIAFRIPNDPFCQALLKDFGAPVVATSANISAQPAPRQFSEINPAILKGVDYVVPLKQEEICTQASRVLKVDAEGTIHVLRD